MLSSIKKNVTSAALRDVHRLNFVLTGLVFLCSLIFLLLSEDRWVTTVMALKSAIYIFSISFIQSYILRYCMAKYGENLLLFRLWRYGLSYLIGISIYLLLWQIFGSVAGILPRLQNTPWMLTYSLVAVMIVTIINILHDFVILHHSKIQTDLENSRLQMKNTEAENLLLKQQIQPHFLFNALSTLKTLYKSNPEKGEHYLLQLADFLRVAVSHNKKFTAALQEELAICRNYLEMQKIRFGDSLDWELVIENPEKLKGYIPSFSLQPLLENAIKHNVLTRERPLKIKIHQFEDSIEVSNIINSKEYGNGSTGSGLANLSERYYLLTGDNLIVQNDGHIFLVRFKIATDEGHYH